MQSASSRSMSRVWPALLMLLILAFSQTGLAADQVDKSTVAHAGSTGGLPGGTAKSAAPKGIGPDLSFFHPTDRTFISKYLHPGSYMPLSDIKTGMTGYGLTVFHGDRIDKFNVEIIGVVKKILNGRDAILARLSGGEMGKNCVIKGMSGSPCYINGKLIGAVSFGFDFQKEPIAGITPIVDMLDALADSTPEKKDNVAHLNAPSWAGGASAVSNGIITTAGGGGRMIPLMSPVSLVGFSPRSEQFLAKKLETIGLAVTAGASGGMNPTLSSAGKKIEPGSAVSVLLAEGDFSVAATGTATAKFGDKVVAFGHPFMQGGSINFPMATAYVHQVMPSLAVSFKLASPVNVVGAVNADRPWGIGGRMGRSAKMIPAEITVVDEPRRIEKTYHVSVIDHPELTPELLASTATSAIDATHQTAGPYVARVESKIDAVGIEPIVRTDRFATGLGPKSFMDFLMGGDPVGRYVNRVANSIMNNEFQRESIKNVKLKITIQDGHKTARIDRVYVDKPFVAPGEDVKVTAVIKPFNQQKREETLSFTVPRDIPDGNMLIGIAGGADYENIKNRMGIVDPEPENLKQIAQRIREESRGDQISLVVGLPEQSLLINGQKLINPPAYWAKVFFSNRHTKGPAMAKGEMKVTRDQDWMLDGSHIIAVEVRSPDKSQAKTAPFPIATPSNNSDDLFITEQARKALNSFSAAGRKGAARAGAGANNAAGISIVMGGSTSAGANGGDTANTNSTASSASKDTPSPTITASTGKEYPHVRPLQIWRQDSEEDFRAGKLDDATVDSWGRLSPGFDSISTKQVSTEHQIWSGKWSNGYFYYGSADEIWRWSADGSKAEKVCKLDGLFIPAMTVDSRGVLYASAVPSGKIYSIDTHHAEAAPQLVCSVSEPIVASLAVDADDNLFIGTASTGRVYKVQSGNRKAELLFDTQQAHVMTMFYSKSDQKLYIGTGEKGSIYSIDNKGKAQAVYQSPDHFITGIAKDKRGDLYVSSAGNGHLVRIAASGEPATLASSDAFYTLHYDECTDSVFSGDAEGDITMACLDPLSKQPYFMPVCHTEQEAVLALTSDGINLYAGSSNLAVLRSFKIQLSSKPVFTSSVRDSGRSAQWSRMRVYGTFNEISADLLSKVKVVTRTGETSQPDQTWSGWKDAILTENSFAIQSPSGRYFQYQLSWNTAGDRTGSEKIDKLAIGRIDTTFLAGNTAPQISSISLKSGSAVGGKQDLAVTGTDADGDNLILSLDLSSDGGSTWKTLKEDIRTKSAPKESSPSIKSDSENSKHEDSEKETDKSSEPAPTNSESTGSRGSSEADGATKPQKRFIQHFNMKRRQALSTCRELWSSRRLDDASDNTKDGSKSRAEDKSADDAASDKAGDNNEKESKKSSSDKSEKTENGEAEKKPERITKKSKKNQSQNPCTNHSTTKNSTEGTSSTESFAYSWETAKQKDGNYLIRFAVDDKLSNPSGSQKVVNLRSVTVDNTAPEIELIDYKRDATGKLEFKVKAKDNITSISNATYRIDEGEPFALSFDANSIDGLSATLIANELKVERGSHKIEVKVSDRAGNTATRSISIK